MESKRFQRHTNWDLVQIPVKKLAIGQYSKCSFGKVGMFSKGWVYIYLDGGLSPNLPQIEVILLMAEILHQLRLVVYPIIYRVSYIPGGDRQISAINV